MREREKSAGKSRENETGWEQNAVKVSLAVWSREIFWIWREERLNVAITKSRHVKRAGASNIITWRAPFIQEKKISAQNRCDLWLRTRTCRHVISGSGHCT